MRYYLDTCIWRDYFENRSDRFRPLGEWALRLINKIIEENSLILFSELVVEELREAYTREQVNEIFSIMPRKCFLFVDFKVEYIIELNRLKGKFPTKDAKHLILAVKNNAILVTRDEHFIQYCDEFEIKKPEELI